MTTPDADTPDLDTDQDDGDEHPEVTVRLSVGYDDGRVLDDGEITLDTPDHVADAVASCLRGLIARHDPAPVLPSGAGRRIWRVTRCRAHRGWADDPTADCPGPCDDCTYRVMAEFDVPMTVRLKTGWRPLTHNDRMHWARRKDHVKQIRDAVGWSAKAVRIGGCEHITVTLHYQPGSRSVTDAPNLTATSKPAIDGLVDARVVPDDTDRHVTEHMPVIHPGPGERRLWLEVELTEED